ncbi:MAG: transketolase [Fusobacteriota bacterium]
MRDNKKLDKKAKELRQEIVKMICLPQSGHPGGSLSAIDILIALYYDEMNVDPENPRDLDRDRFVLSKGHAAPAIYAVLADLGFFDKKELKNLRKFGSILQGHPDMKKVPGIDISTGSLGQGLSVANGMALAAKIDNRDNRVHVLLGDGELQEGQVWEAALTAVHQKLDNLIAFVDYNNLQIDGKVSDVKDVYPVGKKFDAFGWNVLEIDGHNFDEIFAALDKGKSTKGKPTLVVANTVKGKGVSFMENECGFHGKAPSKDETDQAIKELS